jgi:hypothetical protein
MSQLLINQNLDKRSKVELRVDQKFQIIEYHQKHPTFKQKEMYAQKAVLFWSMGR